VVHREDEIGRVAGGGKKLLKQKMFLKVVIVKQVQLSGQVRESISFSVPILNFVHLLKSMDAKMLKKSSLRTL